MQGNKPVLPGWVIALVLAVLAGGMSALAVFMLSKKMTGGD